MNQTSDKIRYFLYARKSSESEEKQVASIDSQITELERLAKQYGLTVVRVFSESKSAKAPNNRPVFGEMMERLYKGEAEGILCWKLDRLARNPVDGGTINWILQNGIVKHIRTFDREYLPTDNVLMMSVEFGMANQFIRDLSSNTKRGLNSKAEKGVFPSRAPIGYLNDKYHPKGEKKIIPDPERFSIIRKLWDELLEKECTIDSLHTLATEKYHLTGFYGKPVHINVIYDIFTNPFYCGMFNWNKKIWQGTHEPMISKEEFERAQLIISGKNKGNRKRKHDFPFAGTMHCGECGCAITAEFHRKKQVNGNVHEYTFYRCSKRKGTECKQSFVRSTELEKQVLKKLEEVEIPRDFSEWALGLLRIETDREKITRDQMLSKFQNDYSKCLKRIDTLKDMRMNREIDSDEFAKRKADVETEKDSIRSSINKLDKRVSERLVEFEEKFSFAETAKEKFEKNTENKRTLLISLGTNFILYDKELKFDWEEIMAQVRTASKEAKKLHKAFEPIENRYTSTDYAEMYSASPIMGRQRDAFRTLDWAQIKRDLEVISPLQPQWLIRA